MFNNREIAVAMWALILSIYVLRQPNFRNSLSAVWRAFIARRILIIVGLMSAYVVFVVWVLAIGGFWEITHLKSTILWTVFVALASIFDASRLAEDPKFAWRAFTDNFKLTAILEFIVNFRTLPLLGEIVLVPIATLFVLLQAFTERKPEHAIVEKFSSGVLLILGFGLVVYAGYQIVSDFSAFGQPATAQDFLMPSALTLGFLPFLYTLVLYLLYERIAARISLSIKDPQLRRYAFRQALRRFHIRGGLVLRWTRNIGLNPPDSTAAIDQSVEDVYEIHARERKLEPVAIEDGWCPFMAGKYLSSFGLETGDYHRLLANEDEWVADSKHLEVGEDVLPPTVAYHIDGGGRAATCLRLILFGNDASCEANAQHQFVELARTLYQSALHDEMPQAIEAHILSANERDYDQHGKVIKLKASRWPLGESEGFEQEFIIQNSDYASVLFSDPAR